MIHFFRNLRLHAISFWAGFIAATLLWWLLRFIRPAIIMGWQKVKDGIQSARQGLLTNTEKRHRIDTLKYVQGLHLTAPLFSLDEIVITPRLIAPPPLIDPEKPPPYEDIISGTIPYTPDCPEMATVYEAKSLGIFECLQSGANIAVIGKAGIGKTTALAYLATKLARMDPEVGNLQNYIPFFIHAANLSPSDDQEEDILTPLISVISSQASALTLPRLSELIKSAFETDKAIVLLDGLDEISTTDLQVQVAFLAHLLEEYPKARVVVTASEAQVDKLPCIGVVPIPLAAWGKRKQAEFIHRWRNLWGEFIAPILKYNSSEIIDPMLLNGWLLNLTPAVTPLEFTLKVWAVYAGDVHGPRISDSIEAYIWRLITQTPNTLKMLEVLASNLVLDAGCSFNETQIQDWLSKEEIETQTSEYDLLEDAQDKSQEIRKISISNILHELIQTGLIVKRTNQRYGFCHPMIVGYLGGTTLARQGKTEIISLPSSSLNSIAISFMVTMVEISSHIRKLLAVSDDPLLRDRMILGRWLSYIPQNMPGRKSILQQLSNDLQNDNLAMGLRIRILTALAISGDPGIPTLFLHLINSNQEKVRKLAALGCGYLRDTQSVGDLINMLRDAPHVGQAACMALVNIGTKPALEAVASVILHGNEMLRRAAAESFATHPLEGHPLLQDGSKVDDLLVRRAVIYGLKRVKEPWATQILEELQIEDAQWVVKDAAAQAVSDLKTPDPSIPRPQPPIEDIPWLIAFASDREMGISPGDPAREMLFRVIEEGSADEILAALGQIRLRGETGIFPVIYQVLNSNEPDLREAAHHTIWHVASMGAEIPPPMKYGLS